MHGHRTEGTYQNTVCMVFERVGVGYFSVLNGMTWSTPQPIQGVLLQQRPALAVYQNIFYLTWATPSGSVYWSAFDVISWTVPRIIPAVNSGAPPCLDGSTASSLIHILKGAANDDTFYRSNSGGFNGKQWGLQTPIPGFGTSTGVALATLNDTVLMLWKGIEGDNNLWSAARIGLQWTNQEQIGAGAATSSCPACVTVDGKVMAVWKGANDFSIYQAWWDGSDWELLGAIPGVGTSTSPALAVYESFVFMAWKGVSDESIWYSIWSPAASWGPQSTVNGVGTSASPALATLNGKLLMAWRGVDDQNIWFNQWDGQQFSPQSTIYVQDHGIIASSVGPALATVGQVIYMVWKGMNGDQGIYSSIWDGVSWTYPQSVKGIGTSFRPALAVVP